MSRFREPQHEDFRALNTSLGFDRRLWPHDVAQSRAHARMLAARGIVSDADRDALLAGLDAVARELEDGTFPFAADDEDIHMAVERRLTELAGPVGGKLHTARSRNDQVATDVALFVREAAAEAVRGVEAAAAALVDAAERHADWPLPGYTHLQRGQPVYLGHHLLAYAWMLLRDRDRFRFAGAAASVLPLGAGALAGVNFDTDRSLVAEELGFASVAPNSMDAVANRDFALDYLNAAATCATHLSRLGAELVLWSSAEFGFCELPDAWTSGSSIMPQKKNPDAAELLRAKAPRVVSRLAALHGVLHALPLTYNKDLQEDKEHLFDAVDTLALILSAARGMVAGAVFDRERMAAAASDELIAATDLADLLVKRGMPFREAHGVVAALVRGRPRARGRSPSWPRRSWGTRPPRCSPPRRGWSRRSRRGAPPAPGSASSSRPCGPRWRRDGPGAARARLLRAARRRGRPRPGRLRRAPRRDRGAHRRDRGLSPLRARLPRLRRAHRADRHPVRAARPRLRLPVLRHPRPAERRLRGRDDGRRRAHPGARAGRRRRPHARAARARRAEALCSGPGKLTQALGIGLEHNGSDLLGAGPIAIEPRASEPRLVSGTRIGITRAVDLPWRFCLAGSRHVSRPWPWRARAARAA